MLDIYEVTAETIKTIVKQHHWDMINLLSKRYDSFYGIFSWILITSMSSIGDGELVEFIFDSKFELDSKMDDCLVIAVRENSEALLDKIVANCGSLPKEHFSGALRALCDSPDSLGLTEKLLKLSGCTPFEPLDYDPPVSLVEFAAESNNIPLLKRLCGWEVSVPPEVRRNIMTVAMDCNLVDVLEFLSPDTAELSDLVCNRDWSDFDSKMLFFLLEKDVEMPPEVVYLAARLDNIELIQALVPARFQQREDDSDNLWEFENWAQQPNSSLIFQHLVNSGYIDNAEDFVHEVFHLLNFDCLKLVTGKSSRLTIDRVEFLNLNFRDFDDLKAKLEHLKIDVLSKAGQFMDAAVHAECIEALDYIRGRMTPTEFAIMLKDYLSFDSVIVHEYYLRLPEAAPFEEESVMDIICDYHSSPDCLRLYTSHPDYDPEYTLWAFEMVCQGSKSKEILEHLWFLGHFDAADLDSSIVENLMSLSNLYYDFIESSEEEEEDQLTLMKFQIARELIDEGYSFDSDAAWSIFLGDLDALEKLCSDSNIILAVLAAFACKNMDALKILLTCDFTFEYWPRIVHPEQAKMVFTFLDSGKALMDSNLFEKGIRSENCQFVKQLMMKYPEESAKAINHLFVDGKLSVSLRFDSVAMLRTILPVWLKLVENDYNKVFLTLMRRFHREGIALQWFIRTYHELFVPDFSSLF